MGIKHRVMGKYDRIIDKPHHVSKVHPQMTLLDRAAQFAPFAALTGYDDMVKEAARVVDARRNISEEQLEELNYKLQYILEHLSGEPYVLITFFVPDSKKDGGKYIDKEGYVKRYDEYKKELIFTDGTIIPLADVWSIESDDIPPEW